MINNKIILSHKDEVNEYIWEFNDNAAFGTIPHNYKMCSDHIIRDEIEMKY